MTQSIAILGRQPALGLAELESIYGAPQLQPLNGAALINLDPQEINLAHLGGSLKIAKLLTSIETTEWAALMKYVISTIPQLLLNTSDGKIRFGISAYGLGIKAATLNRTNLEIKKVIKRQGRSIRVVPNKAPELNTAQTIHNQLTSNQGIELVLIRQGRKTLIGQVTAVQDIESYAARDQKRPSRDAKVGMLPPKLAQIIINLSIGLKGERTSPILLDPFCGTGVILQEALLQGYRAYGSDLEARMIEFTENNLKWLSEQYQLPDWKVKEGDATNQLWQHFDLIASETYLGRPFANEPSSEILREVAQDVDTIHRKFLKNIARQTSSGFRLCIAVPAWKTRTGFQHLRALDSLEEIGYTRISFVHTPSDQLIYHRPGQIVARELVVLQRI